MPPAVAWWPFYHVNTEHRHFSVIHSVLEACLLSRLNDLLPKCLQTCLPSSMQSDTHTHNTQSGVLMLFSCGNLILYYIIPYFISWDILPVPGAASRLWPMAATRTCNSMTHRLPDFTSPLICNTISATAHLTALFLHQAPFCGGALILCNNLIIIDQASLPWPAACALYIHIHTDML